MKTVYFITNNHHDGDTIKIFFDQFKDVFSDVNFEYSKNIKENSTNILLDEFSRFKVLNEIENVKKKYPNTKIICIFSEYITKYPNTFNEFGKNKFSFSSVSKFQIIYL